MPRPARSCPFCGTTFGLRLGGSVEFEQCPGCDAAWFDADELRAYLADRLKNRRYRLAMGRAGQRTGRACPGCAGPLQARSVGGVALERCETCKGILVPSGAHHLLTQRLSQPCPHRGSVALDILQVLGDLLAH